MKSLTKVATIALLLLPAAAAAQATADSATRARIRGMASDLRNLVTAQEAHYADKSRYAADVASLGYRTSTGNTVEFVDAQANRWGAVIRAAGATGTCVIHIGLGSDTYPRTAVEKKAFPEGEPACDGDGKVEAKEWANAAAFRTQFEISQVAKLQEQYFGKTGAYATELSLVQGRRPDPSVTVTMELTPATGRIPGYLLTATHVRYPAANCVLRSGWGPWAARGATMAQKKRPSADLQVVCDDFAP